MSRLALFSGIDRWQHTGGALSPWSLLSRRLPLCHWALRHHGDLGAHSGSSFSMSNDPVLHCAARRHPRGLLGDHCSPISDIAQPGHWRPHRARAHQMPYALVCGLISVLLGSHQHVKFPAGRARLESPLPARRARFRQRGRLSDSRLLQVGSCSPFKEELVDIIAAIARAYRAPPDSGGQRPKSGGGLRG